MTPTRPQNSPDSDPSSADALNKPGKTGLDRLIAATGYSVQGFRATWKHEEAFRLEVCAGLVFVPASFWVGDGLTHQLLLVMSCALVLLAELMNSAIEAIVDRVSHEKHPLSGLAKDIGSSCVFLTMTLFLIVWISSLWHMFRMWNTP